MHGVRQDAVAKVFFDVEANGVFHGRCASQEGAKLTKP